MGKGTIISGGADGLYQVRLGYNRTRIEAERTELMRLLAEIDDTLMPAAGASYDNSVFQYDYAQQVLSAAIAGGDPATIKTASREAIEALAAMGSDRAQKNILTLRKTALQKRFEYIAANLLSEDPTVSAWCADLTEDLTGSVGTVEVPGERVSSGPAVTIRPGYEGAAVYDAARDGILKPPIALGAAEALHARAILPGVHKWAPQYRLGAITAIDGNSCTVLLDAALSSAQNINVNQTASVTASILYMDCHGAAFTVGDRVIIQFDNRLWTNPVVIGFESAPKSCAAHGLACTLPDGTTTNIKRVSGIWQAATRELLFGNIDWRGTGDSVLSWWGVPTRHFDTGNYADPGDITAIIPGLVYAQVAGYGYSTPPTRIVRVLAPLPEETTLADVISAGTLPLYATVTALFNGTIYRHGKTLATIGGTRIAGAALHTEDGSTRMVVVSGTAAPGNETVSVFDVTTSGAVNQRDIATSSYYQPSPFALGANQSPWFFNASGTEGLAVRMVYAYHGTTYGWLTEYHKIKMVIDWINETATVTDLGAAGTRYHREAIDRTFAAAGPQPIDYEINETITDEWLKTMQFFDYSGDVEIVGSITYDSLQSVTLNGLGVLSGGFIYDVSGTQNVEMAATVNLVISGITVMSVASSLSTTASLAALVLTSSGAAVTRRFALSFLDLRSGVFPADITESSIDTSSVDFYEENGDPAATGTVTTGQDASFYIGGLDYTENLTGSSVVTAPVPTPVESTYLFDVLELSEMTPISTVTITEFGPQDYERASVGAINVAGTAAFYPADKTLILTSIPVALNGYNYLGQDWPGTIHATLTSGTLTTLLGIESNQAITPIGAM
jgi:hypothetical protein